VGAFRARAAGGDVRPEKSALDAPKPGPVLPSPVARAKRETVLGAGPGTVKAKGSSENARWLFVGHLE
jgi:hypothetical protein